MGTTERRPDHSRISVKAAPPLIPPLRRERHLCYRPECRAYFPGYRTVVIDHARNGTVVCVTAECHGAEFAGADVWWWEHLSGGAS